MHAASVHERFQDGHMTISGRLLMPSHHMHEGTCVRACARARKHVHKTSGGFASSSAETNVAPREAAVLGLVAVAAQERVGALDAGARARAAHE